MKALEKRVGALEINSGIGGGWDHSKPTHLIGMHAGEDYPAAIRKYREDYPDKVVAHDHNVIWLSFVDPQFNEDGSRKFRKAKEDHESALRDGRSLADVLAEMGEEQ